jgi:hypothetical protein
MVLSSGNPDYFFACACFFVAGLALAIAFAGLAFAVAFTAFAGLAFAVAFTAFVAGFFATTFFFALFAAAFPEAMGFPQQMISAVAHPHASSTVTTRPHALQLKYSPFFAFAIDTSSFFTSKSIPPERNHGLTGVNHSCETA